MIRYPRNYGGKLVIKVSKTQTSELVCEAENLASLQPHYGERWIVFDRDRVEKFDEIISSAHEKQINAAWSNPCIEIWFGAYFGTMPGVYQNSTLCCNGFRRKYQEKTNSRYEKSDTAIYRKLCEYGNEEQAIRIAEKRFDEHLRNCNEKPSEMCPCTTLYALVKEIKSKIVEGSNKKTT